MILMMICLWLLAFAFIVNTIADNLWSILSAPEFAPYDAVLLTIFVAVGFTVLKLLGNEIKRLHGVKKRYRLQGTTSSQEDK